MRLLKNDRNPISSLIACLLVMILTSQLFPVALAFGDVESVTKAPVSSQLAENEFQLMISVPADGTTFILPASSTLGGRNFSNPYNWAIDWGDGGSETVAGMSSVNGGVSHTYLSAGDYTITITPNGSTEAWFAAFGFSQGSSGANSSVNKSMVVGAAGQVTPQMIRTAAQLDGRQPAPDYEWAYVFYQCPNLAQAPLYTNWDSILSVGDYFAGCMFDGCSSLESLPAGFNLPQNITSFDTDFAYGMFENCTSLKSLPDGFNLPQKLTTNGSSLANSMFYGCTSLEYLPAGFNLSQNMRTVGGFYAADMFYGCVSLASLPDGFNLPQQLTSAGNFFADAMFLGCRSLEFLPAGFNLPQNLTSVGDFFVQSILRGCNNLASLPVGFNLPQKVTSTGDYFASNMLNGCSSLTSLPEGFNLPQSLSSVRNNFAAYMFYVCSSLESLPEGFNLPQGIKTAGDLFAYYTFYGCSSLKELPSGFNLPPGLTSVGDFFAAYMFDRCPSLVGLPDEFNLPQGLTSVGSRFAANMFEDCPSLQGLPAEFNLPQGLTSVGSQFAYRMFYGAGGSGFQINEGFQLPAVVLSISPWAFYQTFQLSENAPMQNRTAASIIGNCPTPDRLYFTFDDHFPDIDGIDIKWGGGLIVLIPGTGDLSGDGVVTMDEVLTTAQAALADIGLSTEQLAVIDMDGDGFITMADVLMVYQLAVL